MSSVIFPWPPKTLSPNGRPHFMVLAQAKKAYRAACKREALSQGLIAPKAPCGPVSGLAGSKLAVHLTFYPPNKARRDLDNCLAAMKSGLDGLADAIGVDDSKWKLSMEMADTIGGFVKVEVSV